MKKLMAAAVVFLTFVGTAHAVPYGFVGVNANETDLSGQLWVDVNPVGATGVSFTFYNEGSVPSVITNIFFDDGFLASPVVMDGLGTDYSMDASPGNFPEGGTLSPTFVTTFSASPAPPPTGNGVNNSILPNREWVMISFTLSGGTFDDVLEAIGDELRIGLHVQSISQGGSDSYITEGGGTPNETPEPGTLILLGTGLVGLGLMRRRKR